MVLVTGCWSWSTTAFTWWASHLEEVCSANQWDELKTAQKGPKFFLSGQWPTGCSGSTVQKLKLPGPWSFASSTIPTPTPATTDNHFFKHLNNFRRIMFKNQLKVEKTEELIESWSMDFYTEINKVLLSKHFDCNGAILINKDVSKHSYNDLTFMIWNAMTVHQPNRITFRCLGFPGSSAVKNWLQMQQILVHSDWEALLEKGYGYLPSILEFPCGSDGKHPPAMWDTWLIWVGKIPWGEDRQFTCILALG